MKMISLKRKMMKKTPKVIMRQNQQERLIIRQKMMI